MLLSKEEREKFAQWLENNAESSKEIVEQMRKLGPHGEILAQREIQEASAALLIAAKLRSIEDMTI